MLKLKGRKLFDGQSHVATIRGTRSWEKGVPGGEYWVVDERSHLNVAGGFAYFVDAVKWAKDCLKVEPGRPLIEILD